MWVDPKDLLAWQLALYAKHYKAGYASYNLHYRAATRLKPSRVSVERMEWLVQAMIIERMRGSERSDRKADVSDSVRWF